MLTLGVLSGTSVDAIDVALVRWCDNQPILEAYQDFPWPKPLQQALLALPEQSHHALADLGALNQACAQAFSKAILTFLAHQRLSPADITVIGSHGQTIWHQTQGDYPFSWQLGHAASIAKQTGIPVAADFRMDDIAMGGQGAPLAPALHQQLFAQADRTIGVLNLGGIANLTLLYPDQRVVGFDVGPANTLLDAWFRLHHQGDGFDCDSRWASEGRVHHSLLSTWLSHPYFALAAPKSTGREIFNLAWLQETIADLAIEAVDVQRTLLALTVESVSVACDQAGRVDQLWVCGGGAKNGQLMQLLQTSMPAIPVQSTDIAGYPSEAIEAMLFAWLGKARWLQQPIHLNHITGSQGAAILGGVWLP